MGSEKSLWRTLNKNMNQNWEVQRVENLIGPGTPDLYYTLGKNSTGWLELKYLDDWPKKRPTPVKIEHYTPQQRNWFRRHGSKGANVFLLLQVNKEYLLFDWETAVKHVGNYPAFELKVAAIGYWKNKINYSELINTIR